jgi:peptidoglycan/LPS O-acetylase OafA/YrhL
MTFSKLLEIEYDRSRVYGLDILRAVAVLFVVLIHSAYILPAGAATMLSHFILDGVSIFLVLSGFLIGGILIRILETEKPSMSTLFRFWFRRWLRILPAYYFILVLLILLPAFYTHYSSWRETLKYFFFVQNFYDRHPDFFPEAWSISVEEWFYLSAPVLIFFLIGVLRFSVRSAIVTVALTVISLTIAYRYHSYLSYAITSTKDWDLIIRKRVVTRLDSVMIGIVGAYISYYHQGFWSRYKTFFLALGIITLLSMKIATELSSPFLKLILCVPYFTINAFGTLCLLPFLSGLKSGEGILFRFFTYISLISYSMYLLNLSIVQEFLLRQIDFYDYSLPFVTARYILFWVFTIVGAVILYKAIERPIMDMRGK